jgi:predicted double-glycine peptidase
MPVLVMNSPRNPIQDLVLAALTAALLAPLCGQALADEPRPVKSLLELRQRGVIIQKWDLSCGAAALTTLLRYQFGDDVTEKAVATALIKRPEYIANPRLVQVRQGFSLFDLRRYVDGRGYEGVGLGKLNLQDLEERAPILVPIHILGYNHFVVFRGRLGNRVLLADPAWGNRTMTVEQFESAWIDYPALGHVGFVVETKRGNRTEPDMLRARPEDFVTFN